MLDEAIRVISVNLREEELHSPYWREDEFLVHVARIWAFSEMLAQLADAPMVSPLDTIGLFMTQLDVCGKITPQTDTKLQFDAARDAAEEILMCLV